MFRLLLFCLIIFFHSPTQVQAYAVLTHQAMIDATWETSIVPALMAKYPSEYTNEAFVKVKAYAYGGAILPDIGYFPKGNILFTDLLHYARSGDFVHALISEAKDVHELAFALGVLAHYVCDSYGHPAGVNTVVPLLYHKMKKKYGDTVTYAENKISHMRVEFSFDVLQVARGKYSTSDYHEYIGFEIPTALVERAFRKVYCVDLKEMFPDFEKAVHMFRWMVNRAFPRITRAAWKSRKKSMDKSEQAMERGQFIYRFHQKEYEARFGKNYSKPGLLAFLFSDVMFVLPKFGSMRAFKFKAPTQEAEKKFEESFEASFQKYKMLLKYEDPLLPDYNLDIGKPSKHDIYYLADRAYCELLEILKKKNYADMSEDLRANILVYYNAQERESWPKKLNSYLNDLNKAGAKQ